MSFLFFIYANFKFTKRGGEIIMARFDILRPRGTTGPIVNQAPWQGSREELHRQLHEVPTNAPTAPNR